MSTLKNKHTGETKAQKEARIGRAFGITPTPAVTTRRRVRGCPKCGRQQGHTVSCPLVQVVALPPPTTPLTQNDKATAIEPGDDALTMTRKVIAAESTATARPFRYEFNNDTAEIFKGERKIAVIVGNDLMMEQKAGYGMQIEKALNEHAALSAVAEAAEKSASWVNEDFHAGEPDKKVEAYSHEGWLLNKNTLEALANLAAIREKKS